MLPTPMYPVPHQGLLLGLGEQCPYPLNPSLLPTPFHPLPSQGILPAIRCFPPLISSGCLPQNHWSPDPLRNTFPHSPHFPNPPLSDSYQLFSHPHPALSLFWVYLISPNASSHADPLQFSTLPKATSNDLYCNAFSFVPKTSLLSSIHTPRFTRWSLKVFSFNVCSIFPKLDELSLFSFTYHPDLICINETWLSSDILNNEIAIQNFQLFRLDRNRHGGGVAICAHTSLHAIPLHPNNSLELNHLSVKLHECTFILGAFYRPPSSLTM